MPIEWAQAMTLSTRMHFMLRVQGTLNAGGTAWLPRKPVILLG